MVDLLLLFRVGMDIRCSTGTLRCKGRERERKYEGITLCGEEIMLPFFFFFFFFKGL